MQVAFLIVVFGVSAAISIALAATNITAAIMEKIAYCYSAEEKCGPIPEVYRCRVPCLFRIIIESIVAITAAVMGVACLVGVVMTSYILIRHGCFHAIGHRQSLSEYNAPTRDDDADTVHAQMAYGKERIGDFQSSNSTLDIKDKLTEAFETTGVMLVFVAVFLLILGIFGSSGNSSFSAVLPILSPALFFIPLGIFGRHAHSLSKILMIVLPLYMVAICLCIGLLVNSIIEAARVDSCQSSRVVIAICLRDIGKYNAIGVVAITEGAISSVATILLCCVVRCRLSRKGPVQKDLQGADHKYF